MAQRPRARLTLADLPAGSDTHILGTNAAAAPEPVLARLRDLGFRAGVRVRKVRTAPLGDPAVYRLLGYDTCLRRSEAACIDVAG